MKLCLILCMCLLLGSEFICGDIYHQGTRKHHEGSTNYVQLTVDHVKLVDLQNAAAVLNNCTTMGSSRVKEAMSTSNAGPLKYIMKQGIRQCDYPHPVERNAVSPSGSEDSLRQRQVEPRRRQQRDPLSLSDEMFVAAGKL